MAKVHEMRSIGQWAIGVALASALAAASAKVANAQAQTNPIGFAAAIDTVMRSWPNDRALLQRVYAANAFRPLWLFRDGPNTQALALVAVIDSAEQRGLRPADYEIDALHALLATLPPASETAFDSIRLAAVDIALSRAALHLALDLHRGRVSPTTVGVEMPAKEEQDVSSILVAASRAGDVEGTLQALEPRYTGYAALVRTLGRYRALANDSSLMLPVDEAIIRPNDIYADAPRLRRLLIALGDLSASAAYSESNRYAGALVLAVMHFQRRHGLVPDGTIGAATWEALRVPLAQRVRQIALTLERWRWLPRLVPSKYVVINIPAFRLYAFDNDSLAEQPALSMNVIVGDAESRHDTPSFVGEMSEVVFRPYWDIPLRIARTELVPAIKRGTIDMASEGYEIVGLGDAPHIYRPTRANLDRVSAGTLRLRQRPGNGNALGLVKFVFPNHHDVYLHGTPAAKLFAFARRDFSHGCIRAAAPATLASFVLAGDSTWNAAAIAAAMHGEQTLRVPLPQPVTVYVLYMTTMVAPDGTVYFYPDLYDGDEELARALSSPPND